MEALLAEMVEDVPDVAPDAAPALEAACMAS